MKLMSWKMPASERGITRSVPSCTSRSVSYTHLDVYKRQTQFGAKEFTGTVTASESLDGATQSRVDVVLLDQDGKIEGGYFKIVDTEPGQAADYDIYAVGAPQYLSLIHI